MKNRAITLVFAALAMSVCANALATKTATSKGKLVLAPIASEVDAGIFVGAYEFTSASCPMFEDGEVTRAYIRIVDDYLKQHRELAINFYGDEAAIDTVKIGQGSGQLLGTDEAFHGKVLESWIATMEFPSRMIVETTIDRPNTETVIKGRQTLEIDADGALVYTREEKPGLDLASCKMFPELTKSQKQQACEAIVSNIADQTIKDDAKACLKAGEFAVTANDGGQWWIVYKAKNLFGTPVTCEFGVDKPIGDYAPALESCSFKN